MDRFEKKYSVFSGIKAAFDSAKADGDKEGMEKAQDDYQAFAAEVAMEGKTFEMLFEAYRVARLNGNTNIHLKGSDAKKAEQLAECMRRSDVHYFTYHGCMNDALKFQEAGCHPVEFRMVRGEEDVFAEKGYDEIPSILFWIV